jgi:hypothetical protein
MKEFELSRRKHLRQKLDAYIHLRQSSTGWGSLEVVIAYNFMRLLYPGVPGLRTITVGIFTRISWFPASTPGITLHGTT